MIKDLFNTVDMEIKFHCMSGEGHTDTLVYQADQLPILDPEEEAIVVSDIKFEEGNG